MNFVEHHDSICRETLHHYKNNEQQAKLAYELYEEKLYNIVRHHRNQGEEELVINQMTQLGQEILRDKYITNLVHHLKSKEQTIYASYGIINRLSYSLQSYIKSLCYLAFYIKEHHIQKLDNLYKNYFKFDILQLSLAVDPRLTYILQNHSYMREHLLIKFCHRYQLNQQMFYIYQVNQYTTYYQAFNMEFIQEDNNDLVSNEFARVQQSNPNFQQTQSAYQQPYNYQNSAYQQSPMNPYPINQSTINQTYNYNSQYQPPQYPNSQINFPANNMQQPYANMYQQQSNIYTPSQNQYNPNCAYPPSPGIQSGMQPGYPVYPPSPGMQPAMQPGMQPGIQQNSGFQPNPQLYNTGQQYSNNQMVQPSGYQQNAPAFQPVLQSFSQPQPNIQQQQITNTYVPNQVPNNPVPYNSQQQPVPYQNQQQIPTNNPNNQQQYQLHQQPQINNQVVKQNNQQQQTNNLSIQIPINQEIQQQVEANQQQQQNINNQGLSDQQQQQAQDNIKQSPMTQTIILTPEPELQQSIVIKKSTNVEYQESNNSVQNQQPQEVQAAPQQNFESIQSEQQQQQLQSEQEQEQEQKQEQEQIQIQQKEQEQKQEQENQPESSQNNTQQQQEQLVQQGDLKSRLLDESVEFISTIKPNQQTDFSNSDSVYIITKPEPQIQIIEHKSVCEQLFQIRKPQLNPISIKEDGLILQIKLTQTNLIQNRQVETPYNLDESALARMERRIQSQKYQKVDYDQFIKQVLIDW